MTGPTERVSSGRLAFVTAAAALMLAATAFYTVERLSKDDCTAITNTMPDGSRVTTTTCS